MTLPIFSYCCLFFFFQGFLKLSVWLHLNSENIETYFNHADGDNADEQMLDVVTADETRHSPPACGSNVAELRSVGQVEISDEATLEDLKTQVCVGSKSKS